jgi:uncharacterized protein YjiS (DUF1127 family)
MRSNGDGLRRMQNFAPRRRPSLDFDRDQRVAVAPLNVFHLLCRFSRLPKRDRRLIFLVNSKNGVTMALIQTDRDNVIRLTGSLHSPVSIRPVAQLFEHVLLLVRRSLVRLAAWSAQRRTRNGLTMAERARQRRELAQLSDRELHDIGITRYDIEFVLRRARER